MIEYDKSQPLILEFVRPWFFPLFVAAMVYGFIMPIFAGEFPLYANLAGIGMGLLAWVGIRCAGVATCKTVFDPKSRVLTIDSERYVIRNIKFLPHSTKHEEIPFASIKHLVLQIRSAKGYYYKPLLKLENGQEVKIIVNGNTTKKHVLSILEPIQIMLDLPIVEDDTTE